MEIIEACLHNRWEDFALEKSRNLVTRELWSLCILYRYITNWSTGTISLSFILYSVIVLL